MIWTLRNATVVAIMIAALWLGLANDTSAQTISSTDANPAATLTQNFIGQSFTATVTGTVTTIRVRPRAAQNTTLYLYNGPNTGQANGPGTPVSQQAVALTDRSVGGFDEFVLNTPLPVTAGTTYAFAFGAGDLTINSIGPGAYPGGGPFTLGTSGFPSDLIFQVVQVATPAAVPTLSEWAMILLGLMLAGGAALYLQRRQMAV